MGRAIELEPEPNFPSELTIKVGDLLKLSAAGGRIHSGAGVLEMLGPFIPGVVGDNGQILSPMGAPNSVFFLARNPGRASIEVVMGDPWHAPTISRLIVTVEPS